MPWLLFAQPFDPAVGGLRSIYMSDQGFVTQPGDVPSNTYWDRRIVSPFRVTESLYGSTRIGGRSELSLGEIVLANNDGGLDALDEYFWDGRLVELRYTPVSRPVLSDFAVVWSGTAEQLLPGDELVIRLRDLQALLDVPYQPNRYLGTGGTEGGAELEGRRKPRALGVVRSFEPILVDPANLVYQIHDGAVDAITDVRDRGLFLGAPVTNHPSYAALIAATVTAGTYHTCLAQGLFRLGAVPAGILTVHSARGARPSTYPETVGALIELAVTHASTLTAADFEAGTVAAIDALCPQALGHWYDGSTDSNLREVLDLLANSVGVTYGFTTARRLRLARFEAPASTPDHVYTARELIALRARAAAPPLKTITLGFQGFERPFRRDEIAAAAPPGEIPRLTTRWLRRVATNTTTAAQRLLSTEERFDTRMQAAGSVVQVEANRRRDLYSVPRKSFEAEVQYSAAVQLGQTVELRDPRFGLAAGRRFRVLRLVRDAAADRMTMELWG